MEVWMMAVRSRGLCHHTWGYGGSHPSASVEIRATTRRATTVACQTAEFTNPGRQHQNRRLPNLPAMQLRQLP